MFTLNFKQQFAPAVEAGEKRQTIRALRKDGRKPSPGDDLRLFTGMRTTACRRLLDAPCTEVVPVRIFEDGPNYGITVNGNELTFCEQVDFARADGFGSRAEFLGFFVETHGLPFEGLMICWEPRVSNAALKPGHGRGHRPPGLLNAGLGCATTPRRPPFQRSHEGAHDEYMLDDRTVVAIDQPT